MSELVTRLYASSADAHAALAKLKEEGFTDDLITWVAPDGTSGTSPSPHDTTGDKLTATIMGGFHLQSDAKMYAAEVRQGRWLVSVRALFGVASTIAEILDEFHPVPSNVSVTQAPFIGWDEAAPASSALRLPVKSDHPTPLSHLLGIKVLIKTRQRSSMLGLPLLTQPNSYFTGSGLLTKGYTTGGMGLLTKDGKPILA